MSDWLDELQRLESEATPVEWRLTSTPEPKDKELPVNVGRVGGEGTTKTLWAWVGHHQKRLSKEQVWHQSKADPELVVALRNHASELIFRARRAEEIERENESRYSDREAFLADANLMVQEKTCIMREVQELTTRMPPAALKFMGYALIEAGRKP